MKLKGKVAIISGAASGIGRATAKLFAQEGASIGMVDANEKNLREAAQEISKTGARAEFYVVDVRRRDQIEGMITKVRKDFPEGIHILVNCAGVSKLENILEATEENWDFVMDINLKGTFLMGQACAKLMVEKKNKSGRIVNFASTASLAYCSEPLGPPYYASKAGVAGLTRAMAVELAPYNITVNAVSPGVVVTPMTAIPLSNEVGAKRRMSRIPLNRFAQPEEVAALVLFLASDDSGFISGDNIPIDGASLVKL
jgi:NAD(P)-dependent dehydrogenase (short-subunit alcohol dehydrogenase family)